MNSTEMQEKIDNASLTANDIRENADTALLLLITNIKAPIEFHHEEESVFDAIPGAHQNTPVEMIKEVFIKGSKISHLAEMIHQNANNPTFLLLAARMMQKQMEIFLEQTLPEEVAEVLDALKNIIKKSRKED